MKTRGLKGVRWLVIAVLACLVPCPATAAAPEPVLVVSVASADQLLKEVGSLTEAAGAGDMGRLAIMMTTPYTAHLQMDKPIGFFFTLDGDKAWGTVFLPVRDLRKLLAALKDQIGEAKESEGGLLELKGGKTPLFVKERGGWAFASSSKEGVAELPADPVKLLGGLNSKYIIGARLNNVALPPALRAMAIEQLNRGFEEGMRNDRSIDARQREVAEKVGRIWVKTIASMIQELQYLTVGLESDAASHKRSLEIELTAVKGTPLATKLVATERPSAFAGFLAPGHAASLHVNSKWSDDDISQAVLLLGLARAEALKGMEKDGKLKGADRETAKGIINRLLDVVEETFKSGTLNGGVSAHLEPKSMSVVTGCFVPDGKKLEQIVRDFSALGVKLEPKFPGVKFDVGTHGGIALHTVKVPMKDVTRDIREALGDPMNVVLGIGKNAVFVAYGKKAEESLTKVIDASQQKQAEKTRPAELSLSLKALLQFAQTYDKNPGLPAALEQLTGSDGLITLSVVPCERGMSVRLSLEESVIKAVGAAGKAAKSR